jgi:hypothetical protein
VRLLSATLVTLFAFQASCGYLVAPALAASSSPGSSNPEFAPAGTMLLPLTPKLDLSKPQTSGGGNAPEDSDATSASTDPSGSPKVSDSEDLLPSVESMSAEKGQPLAGKAEDDVSGIDESGKLLQGTVQIVADDTEYDQDANSFLGTGNAVALIGGQDSKLEADSILYDQNKQVIDARGNVRILRGGQLTTGSAFKFKVTSDEYLITNPDTSIQGSEVIARRAYGSKNGLAFKDGTISLPTPFYYRKYYNVGPMQYREESNAKTSHPDEFLPSNPHMRFKARKIVYERYKEDMNMTVFGGRIQYGAFSVPTGKFTMTVGQTETRAVFPVLPYVGTNFNMGGISAGPLFSYGVGKTGILSWSPMVQFGGANLTSAGSTYSGVGLGARAGFGNNIFQTHIAYGSVSNLLVADFKTKVYKSIRFQGGINRFLNDGIMGTSRARVMAEFVDVHQYTKVPLLSMLQFRTTAGWAQDNPQLVNISANYAKLFGSAANSTVIRSGFRVQEQVTATTAPIFSVGDDRYGLKGYITGAAALRGYSTGDASFIGQIGPMGDLHLGRLRLLGGYTEAAVRGSSPFVFDQYLQGSQSVYTMGDVKLSKYLDIGGLYGYSLTSSLPYAKTVQVAVGPPDMKLLVSRDFVLNRYRLGFDMLYGQPVPYQKMLVKGNPDQGQLGGI